MKMLRAAAVAAVGGTLAFAGPVDAAGTKRVVVERGVQPYAFSVDCGDFGPYGFDNVVQGRQRTQLTDVFADDGTLLKTVIHLTFSETNTNSETGASLVLKAAANEVLDYASNTRTLSGKVALGTRPGGGGTFIQETGRITMTLDTREPLFVAGPHEAFFAGGIDVPVCAALAEA